ncbi:MAG: hypothetical protein P4L71_15580, partial [Acetobacteraceae bacterium]|nr:hypothetical protein [Acetobacteraceae bacterium]
MRGQIELHHQNAVPAALNGGPAVARAALERFHNDWKTHAVMAGLVPAINRGTVLVQMAGTSPAMTISDNGRFPVSRNVLAFFV